MTECERILAKRPEISPDFLKEEVRCDFFVSAWRKKLWLVLLDLVTEFGSFCREHGLNWYLIDGSLLGAARHGGFIPWDDDMDVGMPREDYDRLLSFPDPFPEPYVFQVPGKTPGYYFSFARVRNTRTSALNPRFAMQGFSMGIYLDIFPMDEWDQNKAKPVYDRIRELNIDNSNYMRRSNPKLSEADRARAASWSGRDPAENLREIDALAKQFAGTGAKHLSHAVLTIDGFERNYFPGESFERIVRVPFEGLMLPVPEGYDGALTQMYGDWHAFPPAEMRGAAHSDEDMQPDIPYDEALAAYKSAAGL